jgi:hypothetical protein
MARTVLLWIGALMPIVWGVAHLFPTASVVRGFGSLTEDNRRIITMEWITEGVALIFIGVVVLTATVVEPAAPVSIALCWVAVVGLNTLSVVSLFTGFRIRFLPFRLCPVIFTGCSMLIIAALML